MAILLNPTVAESAAPWNLSCWSNRVVVVEIGDFRLVNVYAPNTPVDREHFFTSLQRLPWSPKATFRAGDFNSVQSPPLGRLGGTRSGRPENAAFQALITSINLVDARILSDNVDGDGDEPDPTDFFTYWGPEAASHIDRFYVP